MGKCLDWSVLAHLGVAQEFHDLLTAEYTSEVHGVSISDSSWDGLAQIREVAYRELTIEFFSSFSFRSDREGHQSRAISFRLGRVFRQMSLLDFAVHLGLFSIEQTEGVSGEVLREYLAACDRSPPVGFDYQEAWDLFGPGTFDGSRTKEHMIQDIRYRVIHRFITCTVVPRRESQEKISNRGLWVLRHFLPDSRHPDLPFLLAHILSTIASQKEGKAILLGFLVTRIARSLGILTPDILSTLTPVSSAMQLINLERLRRMKVAHIRIQGGVRVDVWGEEPPIQMPGQEGVHEEDVHQEVPPPEQAMPEAAAAPHVDIPQFAVPQLPSWEQVFGDRLRRMEHDLRVEIEAARAERVAAQAERAAAEAERVEAQAERETSRLESERRYNHLRYGQAQLMHIQEWNQRVHSTLAAAVRPPIALEPFHPLPDLDPDDPDVPPIGYQSWYEWYHRDYM